MKTKIDGLKINQKHVCDPINLTARDDNSENDDFLTSLARAEEDIRCGRIKKISSLRELIQ